jgi:ferredoxin
VTHLEIDDARCEGHGLCEGIAPTVFSLGDEGAVNVLVPDGNVPEGLEGAAAEASRTCPVAAIRLTS